jgi:prevent-host-death family protein
LYKKDFAMQTINISDFRANLLAYLKKAEQGQEVIVTSHGEALASLSPAGDKTLHARARLKTLSKSAKLRNVVSPLGENWDASA